MPGLVSKIARAVPRRTWVVLAALCITAAVVLWITGQRDVAFVAGVLGLVSWFLNYRVLLEGRSGGEDSASDDDEGDEGGADEAETEEDRGEDDEA
jgi:hypothetical protein